MSKDYPMMRAPGSAPRLLALAAVLILALGACARHGQAPAQQSAQTEQTAAPTSTAEQPAAAPSDTGASDKATSPGNSTSSAPTGDSGSSNSLEHLAGLSSSGALPSSSQWKPGVNYTVISPAQPTTVAPGKVEVLEVFWLGCPHCYALEPYIRQWLKSKPAYIDYVRVPVMWGPVHRAHARLYYTLEALGRDDLAEKVFTYIHDQETRTESESVLVADNDQDTFKQQQAWAVQNGISADAFAKAYSSFYVNTQLQQAQEITSDYEVQGVPFIAVDGKFSTDVGKAGGESKLISLIDFLAAWEHDHAQSG